MNLPQIDEQITLEVEKAVNLPAHVITVVAKIVGSSQTQLIDDIALAIATQVGYINFGLREVREEPWSLVRGDIEANLTELHREPKPAEEVTARIHDLMTDKTPIASLIPVVRLLGNAPWTSKAVEDPHSVAQKTIRSSPGLSRETLIPVTLVKQAAPLFRQSALPIRLAKLGSDCKSTSSERSQDWC